MDFAQSDPNHVESNFLFPFSSLLRTEASLCVSSRSDELADNLSINWSQESFDSPGFSQSNNVNICPDKKKKPVRVKNPKIAKNQKEQTSVVNSDNSLSNSSLHCGTNCSSENGTPDTAPHSIKNSQNSYSAFEDSLILNSRKSNKINPEKEKFKGLTLLAHELNRTGLGVQNRSRFLMRFSNTDKTRIVRFAADFPEKSKRYSITWESAKEASVSNESQPCKCLLVGFIKFRPDEKKKRLYKERKKQLSKRKEFFAAFNCSELEETETTYNTVNQETKDRKHHFLLENDCLDFSKINAPGELDIDQISCSSLIFSGSDPDAFRENQLLLQYVQEEGLLRASGRRHSE